MSSEPDDNDAPNMVACAPTLNDVKVVGGARIHFVSTDTTMQTPSGVFTLGGLKLKSDQPTLVVVQPFMNDGAGRSLRDIVATTIRRVAKSEIVFAAQWVPGAPGRFVGPLAVRFDVMVRE